MKCPGQDTQYWNNEAIYEVHCPKCATAVEFYKDDTTRKCQACGHRFVNPKMDFGCAAYCQFAEQCIGDLPEEFVAGQDSLLKDKVAVEMKRQLKSDFRRIGNASRVAQYAEQIGKEEGGNIPVLLCTAYLYEVAEASGVNSLEVARETLTRLGAKEGIVEAVCQLLDTDDDSIDSRILDDARTLASIEESLKKTTTNSEAVSKVIHTSSGNTIAASITAKMNE